MRFIILIIFSLLIVSCDCSSEHKAYVLDKDTKQPITGAKVAAYAEYKNREDFDNEIYTNADGYYSTGYGIKGKAFSKCPSLKVYITKAGYIDYVVSDFKLGNTDTIYLEKQ
jgi:hypothetical protein